MSTLAVALVLGIVLVAGRFTRYLGQAARGDLPGGLILELMAYQMPGFFSLILPVSLFLGILLALGRMYLESEMAVLAACGVGDGRILRYLLFPCCCLTAVMAYISLYAAPAGIFQLEALVAKQESQSGFQLVSAGRFYTSKSGGVTRTMYAGGISDDGRKLMGLFIAEMSDKTDSKPAVVRAEEGEQYVDPVSGRRYLQLSRGHRFAGEPGTAAFEVISFDKYTSKLDDPKAVRVSSKAQGMDTFELVSKKTNEGLAELYWRISLPLMVPILLLSAVPLARVSPRQGRYYKMIPAMMFYMAYLGLLIYGREWIVDGVVPFWLMLLGVHLLFFSIALAFLNGDRWKLMLAARRHEAA